VEHIPSGGGALVAGWMQQALMDLLPAGEYTSVEFLQPGGMMSPYSVHGTARAVRQQRECYFKAIFPAGTGAGKRTELLTRPDRLLRLKQRFERVQSLGARVPAVPILDVRLLGSDGILFTAMEPVRVLEEAIKAAPGVELAQSVLTALSPALSSELPWLHYDICPNNAGLLEDGCVVLIDLESLYLDVRDMSPITVLAHKGFRDPAGATARIHNATSASDRHAGAIQKLLFNIALLAAECRFGPASPDGFVADDWVMDWLKENGADEVWLDAFRQLFAGVRIDLAELSTAIGTVPAEAAEPRTESKAPTKERPQATTTDLAATAPVLVRGENGPWERLRTNRVDLRRDALSHSEVESYRAALELLALSAPEDVRVWKELRLIALAYRHDNSMARSVVARALAANPNDQEFLRWSQILKG